MPLHKACYALILCGLLLWGCRDNQKEQQLAQREQTLLRKEQEFAIKEADYHALVRMRDSLLTQRNDTLIIQTWPDELAGMWTSKSICRESNCTEYVIGDQRSNAWEFVSDSTGLFTRVFNNNKLIRVYSASYDSTGIRLHYKSDSSSAKMTDMSVELGRANGNLIKGMQTISIANACNAKFSVELTRLATR
ncbi:hypothetical protein [Dyadobacter fermentans]|uniref:Uncharacterized protein n=1 Tax=Dyadobacter fermentans (strain ATCC 700827 / DSM 18053 / CIP 107007 / KCTC 52180 / NS114) TaxID=471854 RepID=C6VYR8_DYAFD|nr:hypothetical protein [Dyadobacter fermentans]ACT93423.1 conserved hypothetical protein [Dyadobacter fermentans DSM 18053]